MKRILQIVGSLNTGGLETVALNCLRYSSPDDYEFDFLVYGDEEGEHEKEAVQYGCKVIRIPSPQKGYLRYCKNLRDVLRQNGPYDIVHAHTYFNSALAMMIAKKRGVPRCIAHSHSVKRNGDRQFKKLVAYSVMRKMLNRYADKFCACSKEAGEWVFGAKAFSKKGVVLPNSIDLDAFVFDEKARADVRQELGLSHNGFVWGCVGRLVEGKNIRFLLDTFARFRQDHEGALVIVGDGVLRQELEAHVKELNIIEDVRFTGTRNDVPRLLSAMDLFVMPSKHEGLGIVLLEAMANGLNCVVYKNAIVEAIRRLSLCVTVESLNQKDWISAIVACNKRIVSHTTDLREDLAIYSHHKFAEILDTIYGK